MLVVFPICHKDYAQAMEQIRWCHELQPDYKGHSALFVFSSVITMPEIEQMIQLADQCRFDGVSSIRQSVPDERGWPQSCNTMFHVTVEYIESKGKQPFFWCEPDCIPLKQGWLSALQNEYAKARRPFIGAIFNHPYRHLNGCAVYPPNIRFYNPIMCVSQDKPFDTVRADLTLRYTHQTPLIHHEWGDIGSNTPWTFPDVDSLRRIRPEAVTFHRSKDRALIERLREVRDIEYGKRPKQTAVQKSVEKIQSVISKVFEQKPCLKDVTLVCADTITPDLALKAIKYTLGQMSFADVKFFTDREDLPHAVYVKPMTGLESYSEFMIKELGNHIKTSHVLCIQWDGYVLNPAAWTDDYLKFDYVGAVWPLGGTTRNVGNGGFSLRSKKLLMETMAMKPPYNPEDQMICLRDAPYLESRGIRFARRDLACRFSSELRPYAGQFGFHNFETAIPKHSNRPTVFHHSGDMGDIIYALPAIRAMGGGLLLMSQSCYRPMPPRELPSQRTWSILAPLLHIQPYIWRLRLASKFPESTEYNFNDFRINYTPSTGSIMQKQLAVCGAEWPQDKPWLNVDFKVTIPDRPILISHCPRRRQYSPNFPWGELVERYGKKMAFVGLPDEHEIFIRDFGNVPLFQTKDALDLARMIAGCKVFIGTQSMPMAIAIGLGKNSIMEVMDIDANCHFERDNIIYVTGSEVEIPKKWL
jgi:hypothetical protein